MPRKKREPVWPEKPFMESVVNAALRLGYRVYHTHDSRRSSPGFPDLVIVGFGRLWFIETKTMAPDSKPTEHQQAWIDDLNDVQIYHGARVLRPVEIDGFYRELADGREQALLDSK
jgi:hypothetical protein